MTTIRNKPAPSAKPAAAAEAQSPAAAAAAVPTAPVAVPPQPDGNTAYAAVKKKLVSITGGHRAPVLPGERFDLKSLMASLQAQSALPSSVAGGAQQAVAKLGPAPTDAKRAQNALNAVGAPPADHPRMQHAKEVEKQLKKEGLPTDASGVHVYVVGDSAAHGGMVARTVAGPVGLAKGADLELAEPMPDPAFAALPEIEQADRNLRALSVKTGSADSTEVKAWAVAALEEAYLRPKLELDYLVEHAPADGQTKIVNMSWGQSESALVVSAMKAAIENPGSPLIAELNAQRARQDKPALDLTRPEAREELRQFIGGQIRSALAAPEAVARLKTARAAATESVANARAAGFLPVAAAGNFFDEDRHGDQSRETANIVATIPGVLSVGSVAMGEVARKGDEKPGKSSSTGADVSAPGVDVPVGIDKRTGGTKDVSGTSFAAPYVASVAALMVKANPNITPDQIEKILQSDAVADNIKGTRRDGAGVIDPVAAVREAKALMKFGGAEVHEHRDLDLSVQRAARDELRKLMPVTTPEYKAAIKLITNDNFIELDPATQKSLLAGLGRKNDPKFPAQAMQLVDSKKFHELGPTARASVAKSFAGLEAAERGDVLGFLGRSELTKLPPQVKDALVAAVAKNPADSAVTGELLKKANDPGFKKLPVNVQADFFKAFEHQNDPIEFEEMALGKKRLLELVSSSDFKKLDPADQGRWMQALAAPEAAVRDRAHERLQTTVDGSAKAPEAERLAVLHRRATALNAPDVARTGRAELPGASADAPDIGAAKNASKAVFFRADGKGIDKTPRPVIVQHVKIDGQDIEVVFPRPMPRGVPSIELIAEGLKGLPASLRSHVTQVIVDPAFKDFMQAASAKDGRPNRIFMGDAVPTSPREMTEMLSHETAHLTAADKWKSDPNAFAKWEAAIASDTHSVSNYATHSPQEDVAETVQQYYQVKGTAAEAVMKRELPGRYALLKELLGE